MSRLQLLVAGWLAAVACLVIGAVFVHWAREADCRETTPPDDPTFTVRERGPELFVADRPGEIWPAQREGDEA